MAAEPITADNVLINGNKYNGTDAAWLGLDFSEAVYVVDERGCIPNVLRVPWKHPEDKHRDHTQTAIYRVRPRWPLAQFQKIGGQWHLETE